MERASSSRVWAAVQIKSTRPSSHLVLLISGDRRSSRQVGGWRMLQSKIIWLADSSSAPQLHLGVSSNAKLTSDVEESYGGRRKAGLLVLPTTTAYDTVWHQGLALKLLKCVRYRHAPKRPKPVLSLFSDTHRLRGSSEPDRRQTAGVTRKLGRWHGTFPCRSPWLQDIEARVDQRHSMVAEGASWMQTLCAKKLCTMDKGVKGWLVFSCAWSTSLKVECSLSRWAGGMPESTGKNSLRVGFRHPEMIHNVSFNETSSFLVWVLWHQAGATYFTAL